MVLTEDPTLRRVIDVVVEHVRPRSIILFGSRARGEERPDSDYDLMIVEDDPGPEADHTITRVGQIYVDLTDRLTGDDGPVDLLLYNQEQFDLWGQSKTNIVGIARREGRAVYERDRAA